MDVDAIHKALSHPVRRQILDWLRAPALHFPMQNPSPPDAGVCAGLIAARTGLSQSTASAHLARLQRAGLVRSRRDGQWVFFRRNETTIAEFRQYIDTHL